MSDNLCDGLCLGRAATVRWRRHKYEASSCAKMHRRPSVRPWRLLHALRCRLQCNRTANETKLLGGKLSAVNPSERTAVRSHQRLHHRDTPPTLVVASYLMQTKLVCGLRSCGARCALWDSSGEKDLLRKVIRPTERTYLGFCRLWFGSSLVWYLPLSIVLRDYENEDVFCKVTNLVIFSSKR